MQDQDNAEMEIERVKRHVNAVRERIRAVYESLPESENEIETSPDLI